MSLKVLGDKVIVHKMEAGEQRTKSGIFIKDDSTVNAGERGIKSRWAQVYAIGPEQTEVKVGEWVLMEHGRWTEGQLLDLGDGSEPFKIWLADNNGLMAVSEEKPEEIQMRGL